MTLATEKTGFYEDLYAARGQAVTFRSATMRVPQSVTAILLTAVGEPFHGESAIVFDQLEVRIRKSEIDHFTPGDAVIIGTDTKIIKEIIYESDYELRALVS